MVLRMFFIRVKLLSEFDNLRSFVELAKNFINSYISEKHVGEEALKERHLKGRFVRAVILWTL